MEPVSARGEYFILFQLCRDLLGSHACKRHIIDALDISKKRRISNKIKGNAGEPLSPPPYGYTKDPENPKHWIIDAEAAAVVKRIYDMSLAGMGTEQIAAKLEEDEISPLVLTGSKRA